jgi:uncharacterized membrane protein YedE/YeeE
MSWSKRLITRQWPFWFGGLFVGLAEILYYIHTDSFIVVTTGFAQMYAVSEHLVGLNWVGRVYEPGIHWTIIGALLGARLVGIMENEVRGWVRYDRRMLLLAFIGGFLFSFGTRIAAGCTTHHFVGGIPSMSIASWVVLLTGIPFAFLAFKIALKMGLGNYFRHQETLSVACECYGDSEHHNHAYQPHYNPWKDPMRWVLNAVLITFIGVPLVFAIFGEVVINAKDQITLTESTFGYAIMGAVSEIGWKEVLWMTIPGILLGVGIAKCGFGTECSVMAPEAVFIKEKTYCGAGLPQATYKMFRGMLPLQGFMLAIVPFNLYILVSWYLGVGSIPNAAGEQGLYWGHILGGPLLAMGAVLMIGCEVRTYARLGLGYMTALAALPGFFIGYLPYTLFQEQINTVVFGEGLTDYITIPEWMAATFGGTELGWSIGYSIFLIGILAFSFEAGRRFLKVNLKAIVFKNTDELVYPERLTVNFTANSAKPALSTD